MEVSPTLVESHLSIVSTKIHRMETNDAVNACGLAYELSKNPPKDYESYHKICMDFQVVPLTFVEFSKKL